MLKIQGRASSSNVQALMWCIGELEMPYERIDAGFIYGKTDTDEFAALNPNRTVPVLQDGTNPPLWETGAILRYLASRYGNDDFWPQDPVSRAGVDKWAEWAKINIATAFTVPVFWRVERTAKADQDPEAMRAAVAALERKLAIAEDNLQRQAFLAFGHFTLADIQFGHVLYRYFNIPVRRAEFPALAAYYQRLTRRHAYREHVMLPWDELRVE